MEIIPIQNNVHISVSFRNLKKIQQHPFINYYLDSSNLSLNLECKLQWINYGWYFFKTINDTLNNEQVIQDYLTYESNFQHSTTLQSLVELKNLKKKNHQIKLFITNKSVDMFAKDDCYLIENQYNIDNIINALNNYNKNFYLKNSNNISFNKIYLKNDFIRFQLKLNIIEYLAFSSKKLQPIIEFNNKNI